METDLRRALVLRLRFCDLLLPRLLFFLQSPHLPYQRFLSHIGRRTRVAVIGYTCEERLPGVPSKLLMIPIYSRW
jgi:hypothetical protein